ncbi:MAG: Methyltransferase type 12 [Candidatus Eremiobacteraeota bacterium]|nr:Methyltransferase type 12 [Candidatus Eremiobacteraeota bacterium]
MDGERAGRFSGVGEPSYDKSDYDRLAPYYRAYSATRDAYLTAVEAIVIRDMPAGTRSMLDVGSGDGVRAARIARSRGLTTLVLCEPSSAMRACAHAGDATDVWTVAAEDLPRSGPTFDVVTCLWNVLGHVPDGAARVIALRRMGSLLAANGSIFLDVNNRYNARAYGWAPTLRRALRDFASPSETNGDVAMIWSVGGAQIPARTHVFTPRELDGLLREAGLRIKRRHVIDYDTGATRRSVFEGQLLYELGSGTKR